MKLTKKRFGEKGMEITCQIGDNKWVSFFQSPNEDIDHAGADYLENRFKCLTTEKRRKKFKALYKELIKDDAILIPKAGKNLFDDAKIAKGNPYKGTIEHGQHRLPIAYHNPPHTELVECVSIRELVDEVSSKYKWKPITKETKRQLATDLTQALFSRTTVDAEFVIEVKGDGIFEVIDFLIKKR